MTRFVLPVKPQRQLNLTRIENGAWRAIGRVGRTFLEEWSGPTVGGTPNRTEVGGSIGSVVVVHVQGIQQVEAFRHCLQVQAFPDSETPGNSQVDALVGVSPERISSFNPDSVVVSENISVRIKARKLREVMWCLQAHDHAKLPIVQNGIGVGRPGYGRVPHEAVGDVIGRKSELFIEAASVLRYEHEAGIRSSVTSFRPGVAQSPAK